MKAAACLALVGLALAGCGGDDEGDGSAPLPRRTTTEAPTATTEGPVRTRGEPRLETAAGGLEAPWELAFLPDGRALLTERPGRVRLLSRTLQLQREPVAEVEVAAIGEGGLLGMAIDPDFERNRFVYLYRTTASGNEVVRYRFDDARLSGERVAVRGIEAGAIHDGGRIHFGPDDRLYIATGDAGQDQLAQEEGSLNGKLLRIDADRLRRGGGVPDVVSLGHRNPQGFDWQPGSDRLVANEHGPDGDDEVNVIRGGRNYGWPSARGEDHDGFEGPARVYPDTIAPSGAAFVSQGDSAWTGDYLIGSLAGEQIRRVSFEGADVTGDEALFEGRLGRVRTVVEGPDGALYALTNNRDGRGSPRQGDDRVVRIVPPRD